MSMVDTTCVVQATKTKLSCFETDHEKPIYLSYYSLHWSYRSHCRPETNIAFAQCKVHSACFRRTAHPPIKQLATVGLWPSVQCPCLKTHSPTTYQTVAYMMDFCPKFSLLVEERSIHCTLLLFWHRTLNCLCVGNALGLYGLSLP